MSTSAIAPISSIDFDSTSATASQQSVFDSLLSQLQQSIGTGNLTTSQTLLNAVEALSPSSASAQNPLGVFLTSLTTALKDGSVSEAQSTLATYQSNSAIATPVTSTTNTSATAAAITANLVQSQLQLSLVTTLLGPNSSFGSDSTNTSSTPSDSSANSLIGILNAAYGTGSGSSSSTANTPSSGAGTTPVTPTSSTTPYDTLLSSIQASLAAGHGALTPALAYLQATGNFVNTSA